MGIKERIRIKAGTDTPGFAKELEEFVEVPGCKWPINANYFPSQAELENLPTGSTPLARVQIFQECFGASL